MATCKFFYADGNQKMITEAIPKHIELLNPSRTVFFNFPSLIMFSKRDFEEDEDFVKDYGEDSDSELSDAETYDWKGIKIAMCDQNADMPIFFVEFRVPRSGQQVTVYF